MSQDEGKSDKIATYYYVEFRNAKASEKTWKLYNDLIGRNFIFRCHKKFGLDRFVPNLKLCFGPECITQAEAKKKNGLEVRIEEVKPLLLEELVNHSIDDEKSKLIFDK